MTPFVHEFYVNLRTGAAYERAKKPLSQGNALADKIVVHVQDCGKDVDLSGMGVSALVVRFDGQTVPLTGTIEEGAACITLDKDSYAVPGEARVTVMLSAGEMVQTVLVLLLNVDTSQTSIVVDNGTIGDLTDLLGAIAEMRTAIADALEAAAEANQAAKSVEAFKSEISDDIAALSEEIDNVGNILSFDEWQSFAWIEGEYISNTNGTVLSYTGWKRTDYVDISGMGSPLTFRFVGASPGSGLYNAFYDVGKNFVSSFKLTSAALTVTVPDNARYMRLSNESWATPELLTNSLSVETARQRLGVDVLEKRVDAILNGGGQAPDVQIYTATQVIPDYYFASSDTPKSFEDALPYLESRIRSIPDGKHLIFLTDPHVEGNAGNANKVIQYVRNALGGPYVINGGDYYDADDNRYLAMRKLAGMIDESYAAYGDRFLPVLGNHETNAANIYSQTENEKVLTFTELAKIMYHKLTRGAVVCNYDSKIDALDITEADKAELKQYFRNNYHVDDVTNETRYVVYNTGSPGTSSVVKRLFGVSSLNEMNLALDWFDGVLKTTPAGYDIVLCGHEPAYYDNEGNRPLASTIWMYYRMLAMYKSKGRETFTLYEYGNAALTEWIGGTTYSVDYRNVPDVGKVVVLGGHWHRDYYVKYEYALETGGGQDCTSTEFHVDYSAKEIPLVFSQCDAFGRLDPDWGHAPHPMSKGTITEQCFDVVTITDDNRVVFTRFGAGVDRVLHIDG